MPRKAIPDKWDHYTCFKQPIAGTRIIPFKTPLKESAFSNQLNPTRWTPRDVMAKIPNLGLIINLCFAQNPYYVVEEFVRKGVDYVAIPCKGQVVPNLSEIQKFTSCVENFLSKVQNNGKLIGVHCTHGVNRTGYVVCSYLMNQLKLTPRVAVHEFQKARGHAIDRREYVDALHSVVPAI